jgi:hypothetical protein
MEEKLQKDLTDRWGMILSGICFIHCTLPPFIFFSTPLFAYYFYHPWIHPLLTLLVVPLGLSAFWSGFKIHHNATVFTMGLIGVLSIISQQFMSREVALKMGPTLLLWIGSGLMVLAHFLNFRLRRQQKLLQKV